MKVVILAGGHGTRISEVTKDIPKPMITIGNKPILWHIMKIYSHYKIDDFIICMGYKSEIIKEYFEKISEPWNIKLIDTGLDTMTGGRIKKVKKHLENESFCLTYGDDLKAVDISRLISFHNEKKKFVTLTAAKPPGRYGILTLENDLVKTITEKPPGDNNWINGGYYVLEPEIFDYIHDDTTVWEQEPLQRLATENQISAYKYEGFYQPLDTFSDKTILERLWNSNPYWKIWK
jgi:glucose-1-phosphate cytidylyltransferase